ncbi:MAG: response regulator transcription factor [Deltaproteobacteria bacterium]|nr:response regulator transcription factor [Deltaproteobacteria bacterium]
MIRIVIADDHPIVRDGLKKIISDEVDMEVVGEAGTALELFGVLKKNPCDVVILDIAMPGMSGIDALGKLHSESPGLPVLVLSIHPENQYALRTIRAGASGYLSKDAAPQELTHALQKIANGGRYISPSLAERIIDRMEGAPQLLHDRLSDREFEIMKLIAAGQGITEIALKLHLSPKTVSTYRTRILLKMDMRNNADMTRYCMGNDLL